MARIRSHGQAMGGSEISRPSFVISDHGWNGECPIFYSLPQPFPSREKALLITKCHFRNSNDSFLLFLVFSFCF